MSRARTLANYVSSGVTAAEFDYLDGVTSAVQTQLDSAGGGLFSSYAILLWEESANTASGTLTSGAWRTVTINTELADPDNSVTISSNQFTLGAGTYYIEWMCEAVKTTEVHSQLYDITGTATIKSGMSGWTAAGAYGDASNQTHMLQGCARVTPSGSNAYEVQLYAGTTRTSTGFGIMSNHDSKNEHYATVKIYKES